MNLPLLAIFLVVSLAHFVICLTGWRPGYLATKPLLVPLLLAVYLCSAAHIDPLVVAALLCGFAGDVALEFPQPAPDAKGPNLPLLAGLGAFFLGHVCYSIVFAGSVPVWSPLPIVLLSLAAAALFLFVLRTLYTHMGDLAVPGTAYLLVLLTMAFFAALSALALPALPRLLGGVLFLLSDYILARSILLHKGKYTDFVVMLTYLAAQFLLVWSLL